MQNCTVFTITIINAVGRPRFPENTKITRRRSAFLLRFPIFLPTNINSCHLSLRRNNILHKVRPYRQTDVS